VPGQQGGTLRGAWNHLRTYATQIPTLQAFPAVHVISTGTQAGMGALGGRFEHYAPWKTIDGHRLAPTGAPELEVLVRGVFAPAVLLRSLLASKASGGIVFSTMQKFGLGKEDREAGRGFPLLSDRGNIVVIADEAHRTQYDLIDGLARNLRDALPNAAFIEFTGTPIEAADRNTRAIFGEYIDVYDLTQAVEDGATVRVYCEARLAKVELPTEAREALDTGFEEVAELAETDIRERLKTRWAGRGSRWSSEPASGSTRSPRTSCRTGRPAEACWPARRWWWACAGGLAPSSTTPSWRCDRSGTATTTRAP